MDAIDLILDIIRKDVFISFGILTIPLLILKYIPQTSSRAEVIDYKASQFVVFCGILYTILILFSLIYAYLFLGGEYDWVKRVAGQYGLSYGFMIFSWLLITQPFRFKLVRNNILVRILFIPLFLLTIEQIIIITIFWHRDYTTGQASNFNVLDVLNKFPNWPIDLLLKLGLFLLMVISYHWIKGRIGKKE